MEGIGSRERLGSDDDIKIVLDNREEEETSPVTRNMKAKRGSGGISSTILTKKEISKRFNNQSMNLITMSKIDS